MFKTLTNVVHATTALQCWCIFKMFITRTKNLFFSLIMTNFFSLFFYYSKKFLARNSLTRRDKHFCLPPFDWQSNSASKTCFGAGLLFGARSAPLPKYHISTSFSLPGFPLEVCPFSEPFDFSLSNENRSTGKQFQPVPHPTTKRAHWGLAGPR